MFTSGSLQDSGNNPTALTWGEAGVNIINSCGASGKSQLTNLWVRLEAVVGTTWSPGLSLDIPGLRGLLDTTPNIEFCCSKVIPPQKSLTSQQYKSSTPQLLKYISPPLQTKRTATKINQTPRKWEHTNSGGYIKRLPV